ncbi:EF-hand domain-containing protein [Flavobacterium sp. Arc3]|jgi:Ca2+-binding EF-hand superfamily protein|uniref:EF-hand domain-containing protein n=1 Tax=unclassified Flavobacterium TaxID=196869 RepID=UPI00352DED9D
MKKLISKIVFGAVFILGTTSSFAQPSDKKEGQKPPTAETILKEMDANKDGKLAKSELKGPIKDDFTKIDTNKDGFLSLEELKKAPKPEHKKPRD